MKLSNLILAASVAILTAGTAQAQDIQRQPKTVTMVSKNGDISTPETRVKSLIETIKAEQGTTLNSGFAHKAISYINYDIEDATKNLVSTDAEAAKAIDAKKSILKQISQLVGTDTKELNKADKAKLIKILEEYVKAM